MSLWRKILFNYAYQIKKSHTIGKLNFYSFFYFFRYFFSNLKGKSAFDQNLPWLTFQSYDFIKSLPLNNFVVFEFGSGGSTLFFNEKVKKLISVEHDETWFSVVLSKLNKLENSKTEVNLIKPGFNSDVKGNSYRSELPQYSGSNFFKYASYIDSYPLEYFDLILIDGRSRIECLKHSLQRLKKGGYLIFDNSDRDRYQSGLQIIQSWLVLETYGPTIGDLSFNQTSIFRKPL